MRRASLRFFKYFLVDSSSIWRSNWERTGDLFETFVQICFLFIIVICIKKSYSINIKHFYMFKRIWCTYVLKRIFLCSFYFST